MKNPNYIKFNELMASVESDLSNFADNGLINRGTCIKVARKVNHDLGLKIFREKEEVLQIENYKADLPEDFLSLRLAVICGEPKQYSIAGGSIFGTHTQEVNVQTGCVKPDKTCLNESGGAYWVTQTFKDKVVNLPNLSPIRVTRRSMKFCSDDCLNQNWNSAYELDIENGEVVTNFREGKLYISYLADMVDIDNNVLILDHPLLTPYYEYAIKKHILENALLNGDADVERRLHYINDQLKEARISAINFTNTVEYTDIQDFYRANRVRFYNKYHKLFDL